MIDNAAIKLSRRWPLLLSFVTLAGCSGFGGKDSETEMVKDTPSQVPVVIQASQKSPVYTDRPRAYWLKARQSNNAVAKIKGSLATGESSAAVTLAKARLAQKPGDPELLALLASALVIAHNYDLAAYYAQMLSRAQAQNAEAYNIRGLAKMMNGSPQMVDLRAAMEDFKKSMELSGDEIAAGLNLGHLQLEIGSARLAIQTFQSVKERCKDCHSAVIGYALSLARTGQYKEAATTLEGLLAKKRSDPEALYNLALVYKNGYHNKAQAEKLLSRLVRDDKITQVALKDRAEVVLRLLKGEATVEDRTELARTQDEGESGKIEETDTKDADLLMSGAEDDPGSP